MKLSILFFFVGIIMGTIVASSMYEEELCQLLWIMQKMKI